MNPWLRQAGELLDAGEPAMLVTVARVRGSAPREIGARMLVTRQETHGTIGGGQLEYRCTKIACDSLRAAERPDLWIRRFPLGADCGQCCGGVVDVLFEDLARAAARVRTLIEAERSARPALLCTWQHGGGTLHRCAVADPGALPASLAPDVTEAARDALADGRTRRVDVGRAGFALLEPLLAGDFDIAVFGAGHVGTAAVAVLATLDANIRWIDGRPGLLPDLSPANVQTLESRAPEREVAALPPDTYFLVLTHSHPLDYEICRAVLARGDFAYLGLIGSRSKRRRFEKRFRADGVAGSERLTCPIGIAGITGKKPAEIALAAAAEILRLREVRASRTDAANVHVLTSGGHPE